MAAFANSQEFRLVAVLKKLKIQPENVQDLFVIEYIILTCGYFPDAF